MKKDHQLFRRTTSVWVRLFIASVLSIVLMLIDGQGTNGRLSPVRTLASNIVDPVQKVLHTGYQWFSDVFFHIYSLETIHLENVQLKSEKAIAEARQVQLSQLEQDNNNLRAQLNLKQNKYPKATAAQVLYQVVDPYARKLVLDKGTNDGIVAGQPVVTADGLLGQVTSTTLMTSELTLVLDTKINIPVQVERSKERGFLSGNKQEGLLDVRFFNAQANLQVNDILVTSGLDGLYPEGLPVGRVSNITSTDGGNLSEITVVPTTQGMSVRYVLVLQTADNKEGVARNAAQAEFVSIDKLPTTLGARAREQTLAKENK